MNEPVDLSRQRVLVVDDVRENVVLVASLLKALDVEVLTAGSGFKALELVSQAPLPDLILLDIMMPGMDGYEVFRQLSAQPATALIPVIFMTALDQPGDEDVGLKLGAVDYITKPLRAETLRARVRTQLRLKRVTDRLADENRYLEAEVTRRVAENTRLETRLQLALSAAGYGIWEYAQPSGESTWSDGLCRLLGYAAGPHNEQDLLALIHPDDQPLIQHWIRKGLGADREPLAYELRVRHGDGHWVWLELRGRTVERDALGLPLLALGTVVDISERKAAAARIDYLVTHDTLTDLPNRSLFAELVAAGLAKSNHASGHPALLLLELDRLQTINEVFGGAVGDGVLVAVARRLQNLMPHGCVVARRSGKEFGVFIGECVQELDVIALAEQLLAAIAEPIFLLGQEVSVQACGGVCIAAVPGTTGDELLRAAEIALGKAVLGEGGAALRLYSPQMAAESVRRSLIEGALPQALANGELRVAYQPQVSLGSGGIIGMEALLRWQHPELGNIPPGEFIPLAEENGHILAIGEWVLRTACRETRRWLDLGMSHLRVAVNLSPIQFLQPGLDKLVQKILAETGLSPSALELEVSERVLSCDTEATITLCHKLKAMGVKLVLDDFGSVHSSLVYVSRFPFDKLKIDHVFVRDIVENPTNAAIVSATIVMARSLNLAVVAEGVETEAQANFLRARHCDAMQGFLFERAISAQAFEEIVGQRKQLQFEAQADESQQTLLLLDDEPNILNALNRLLRREGYRILTASSAQDAFDKLARQPVQVIMSDQRMPEMSGIDFFARVRQLYPDTLRILLTGYTDLDAITSAINVGAVHKFLTKPWDDDNLRDQIREAFRTAKQLPRS